MSSPKHSSKNVRNDFPNSVYIKGKPAAQQPRKAPPRGEPAKHHYAFCECDKCQPVLDDTKRLDWLANDVQRNLWDFRLSLRLEENKGNLREALDASIRKEQIHAAAPQPAKALNSLDPCPKCSGSLHYYDGALGYEALRCDRCDYELDLNAAANAKATAEREAPQPAKAKTPLLRTYSAVAKLQAELERVKEERDGLLQLLDDHNITIGRVKQQRDELLAAAKAALDYASDVCPSSALPYESKLKAAIANAEKEAK